MVKFFTLSFGCVKCGELHNSQKCSTLKQLYQNVPFGCVKREELHNSRKCSTLKELYRSVSLAKNNIWLIKKATAYTKNYKTTDDHKAEKSNNLLSICKLLGSRKVTGEQESKLLQQQLLVNLFSLQHQKKY